MFRRFASRHAKVWAAETLSRRKTHIGQTAAVSQHFCQSCGRGGTGTLDTEGSKSAESLRRRPGCGSRSDGRGRRSHLKSKIKAGDRHTSRPQLTFPSPPFHRADPSAALSPAAGASPRDPALRSSDLASPRGADVAARACAIKTSPPTNRPAPQHSGRRMTPIDGPRILQPLSSAKTDGSMELQLWRAMCGRQMEKIGVKPGLVRGGRGEIASIPAPGGWWSFDSPAVPTLGAAEVGDEASHFLEDPKAGVGWVSRTTHPADPLELSRCGSGGVRAGAPAWGADSGAATSVSVHAPGHSGRGGGGVEGGRKRARCALALGLIYSLGT
ncbi:hypothetical protein AAFF_G00341850 [Aldrovandia affinis]|uniref:Uncharacterized protein n=1 Tax=Aldrovandia affinis TaxID=143900 RepID=A0AAD7WPE2_9TELE|nr:hypothetical protein AAFF_G00341850 [Aldrovandia affinis]